MKLQAGVIEMQKGLKTRCGRAKIFEKLVEISRKAYPTIRHDDIDAKLAGLQKPRGWGLFLIRAMVDGMDVTTEGTTQTVTLTLIREERA